MAEPSSIRLFEIEPDLIRFLTEEDRAEAAQLVLPVVRVDRGAVPLSTLLRQRNAFGVIVLEGMLMQSLQVHDQVGHRLLGPGDVAGLADDFSSTVRVACATRTEMKTSLVLLGNDLLVAVHRWPRLLAGLLARVSQQLERVADQLVICQLPRVEDRILAIMWQLAEIWGYVSSSGTVVPLALTHELLGGLIGARRSTVTLAVGRLSERGAMVRSGEAWLLLERPSAAPVRPATTIAPIRLEREPESIPVPASSPRASELEWQAIRDAVARLHEQHERSQVETRERLRRLRNVRVMSIEIRRRIAGEAFSRRPVPSTRSPR